MGSAGLYARQKREVGHFLCSLQNIEARAKAEHCHASEWLAKLWHRCPVALCQASAQGPAFTASVRPWN